MESKNSAKKLSPLQETLMPFVFGTISSCSATTVIQPMDTLKVRLQIASESRGINHAAGNTSVIQTAKQMLTTEGIGAFYHGLGSALMRQVTYGTIRIGLYRYLAEKDAKNGIPVTLAKRFSYSLLSGGVGSFFGNPFDVVLVRFQSDHTLPEEQRRNYRGILDAFNRMLKEEGITSFWKGYTISFLRACAMTSVMLTTNDEVKKLVNQVRGVAKADMMTNLAAAAISGVACSFCSLPFDNIKTKIQKQKKLPDGSMPYSSIFDCFSKTFRREGLPGFWSGYTTFYFRVAPHAMVLLILENLLHRTFNPEYKH